MPLAPAVAALTCSGPFLFPVRTTAGPRPSATPPGTPTPRRTTSPTGKTTAFVFPLSSWLKQRLSLRTSRMKPVIDYVHGKFKGDPTDHLVSKRHCLCVFPLPSRLRPCLVALRSSGCTPAEGRRPVSADASARRTTGKRCSGRHAPVTARAGLAPTPPRVPSAAGRCGLRRVGRRLGQDGLGEGPAFPALWQSNSRRSLAGEGLRITVSQLRPALRSAAEGGRHCLPLRSRCHSAKD